MVTTTHPGFGGVKVKLAATRSFYTRELAHATHQGGAAARPLGARHDSYESLAVRCAGRAHRYLSRLVVGPLFAVRSARDGPEVPRMVEGEALDFVVPPGYGGQPP